MSASITILGNVQENNIKTHLQVRVNNSTKDITRVLKILSLGGYHVVQQNQCYSWMDSDTYRVEVSTM